MFQKLRGILTTYDKILIISILLFTIVGIGWSVFNLAEDNQSAKYVVIEHKNQVLNKFRLTSDFQKRITIDLDHGTAEIMVENGEVRMMEMPREICPLGICSDTGWVSNVGETIVCIPNQIVIAVEAQDSEDKIDGISY
ncbi:NusG domain II-containing protein [Acetohalobium arabaticum]|uniref:Uncharacterized protein n=1 Tax=Acetohalobium arabaticum (strain ATCC 49924 / DSM 5501 / Z-7288) TaxID=574087 RepID=D9QUR8_ACEAZ|nr:NusG domain II-containing protein [Acetohalobium arabaticum]ADL11977.1 protein of unknown function DUF1312 [Acetohalobium arabaticum DSM 5501]